MSRREVQGLLADDLKRVEKVIGTDTICSVEAVTAIRHHLQKSGGKRLLKRTGSDLKFPTISWSVTVWTTPKDTATSPMSESSSLKYILNERALSPGNKAQPDSAPL